MKYGCPVAQTQSPIFMETTPLRPRKWRYIARWLIWGAEVFAVAWSVCIESDTRHDRTFSSPGQPWSSCNVAAGIPGVSLNRSLNTRVLKTAFQQKGTGSNAPSRSTLPGQLLGSLGTSVPTVGANWCVESRIILRISVHISGISPSNMRSQTP